MKNALIDPVTLALAFLAPKTQTMSLLGYPKFIRYTKFEHFGIIRFELCFGQTDKQTNMQTEANMLRAARRPILIRNHRPRTAVSLSECNYLKSMRNGQS